MDGLPEPDPARVPASEPERAASFGTGSASDGERELLEALREERRLREVAVAQRVRLSKRVEALQTELTATKAHLRASIAASEHVRSELEELWGSNSWR